MYCLHNIVSTSRTLVSLEVVPRAAATYSDAVVSSGHKNNTEASGPRPKVSKSGDFGYVPEVEPQALRRDLVEVKPYLKGICGVCMEPQLGSDFKVPSRIPC